MIEVTEHPLPHGITLSCRTAGQRGRPVLMFLHGFPEAAFVWDALLEHFSQPAQGAYFCIAPMLRGYAPSSSPADVKAYRARHLMQDIAALITATCPEDTPAAPLAGLVAHDWGGAIAWNLADSRPDLMRKLAIINSPHPATFWHALQHSPAQQAASAYMNFLVRPDAETLLAADDYRRLWTFFTGVGTAQRPTPWLTESVRAQYREVWRAGLTGPLNYYRASPLRPPQPGAVTTSTAPLTLPPGLLNVALPTLVLWATGDDALLPELLEGLDQHVHPLRVERIEGATHWVVHEQPALIAARLEAFLH